MQTSKLFKLSSWSFFSKRAKLHVNFKNLIKLWEIIFGFSGNCLWTRCGNFCQLWREYMWSSNNVLKSSIMIFDLIQRDVFYLNFSSINGNLEYRCCRGDFSNVWIPWTHWLPKGLLKQELFAIHITTFFRVNNFETIKVIKLIFFSKCVKFHVDFKNAMRIPQITFGF